MECDLGRISVHYEVVGDGEPVLMLHGSPLDHTEMMYEMEPVFEGRDAWERIYPDLPGCGSTPGPDWITTENQMLQVVEEFLDKIIPQERFVVVGTSYGGYLARGLVHNRGSQMDGLLLNVPVVVPDSSKRTRPSRQVISKNQSIIDKAKSEKMEWLEDFVVAENETVLEYARALNRCVADEKFLNRIEGGFSFDVDTLPEPFKAPTLFIVGRQDHGLGYSDAWGRIESFPRATFAVLDRAGHLVRGEQPELWRSLVGEWLDRVEEWISLRPVEQVE